MMRRSDMESTKQLRKTPTNRKISALEKFGVNHDEIDRMNFEQARDRLDFLIKKARERDKLPIPGSPDTAEKVEDEIYNPEYGVKQHAIEAKRFVEREFGTGDYFASAIIAAVMREEFSIFMSEKIQRNKLANVAKIKR
jgi:hypothetical protein